MGTYFNCSRNAFLTFLIGKYNGKSNSLKIHRKHTFHDPYKGAEECVFCWNETGY